MCVMSSLNDSKVAGFWSVVKTLWQTLLDGRDDDCSAHSRQRALPPCLPPLFTANFILMLDSFKRACRYSLDVFAVLHNFNSTALMSGNCFICRVYTLILIIGCFTCELATASFTFFIFSPICLVDNP